MISDVGVEKLKRDGNRCTVPWDLDIHEVCLSKAQCL